MDLGPKPVSRTAQPHGGTEPPLAVVESAIDRLAAPLTTPDGAPDPRTICQRREQVLAAVCRAMAARGLGSGARATICTHPSTNRCGTRVTPTVRERLDRALDLVVREGRVQVVGGVVVSREPGGKGVAK